MEDNRSSPHTRLSFGQPLLSDGSSSSQGMGGSKTMGPASGGLCWHDECVLLDNTSNRCSTHLSCTRRDCQVSSCSDEW